MITTLTDVSVIKRDGKLVPYSPVNISIAITKAVRASHNTYDPTKDPSYTAKNDAVVEMVTDEVEKYINDLGPETKRAINVETIQDYVERALIKQGYADTAKEYILYRKKRNEIRNTRNKTAECIEEILGKKSDDSDLKRDNANINGDTAMGTMLQIGANVSKEYYLDNRINKTAAVAHRDGHIHIHDLDFYDLTVTCCQIDCKKLFKDGFNTGHGYLREPKSIGTAASLAAIAIQSDQNDCHGGQSIPNFDYSLAPYVKISLQKNIKELFVNYFEFAFSSYWASKESIRKVGEEIAEKFIEEGNKFVEDGATAIKTINKCISTAAKRVNECIYEDAINTEAYLDKILSSTLSKAYEKTDKETYQAMEGFIHNCNTLHSRAGAQVKVA